MGTGYRRNRGEETKGLVSVILNSYSRPEYVEKAIVSVIVQSYSKWELIIVDDGSPRISEIREIVNRYKSSGNIRLYERPHSENLARRRNDGLEVASGEYICLLDDDNQMHEKRLEICVEHLNSCHECGGVYHLTQGMDPNGVLTGFLNFYRTGEVDLQSLLNTRNHIDSGEVMLRRSTLNRVGLFDEKCIVLEDWDMWRRIFLSGTKMHFVNAMLSLYRMHNGRRVAHTEHLNTGMAKYILDKLQMTEVGLIQPDVHRLTFSQLDVCQHFENTLKSHVFGGDYLGRNISFLLAPFQLVEADKQRRSNELITTIHLEDPYAISVNMEFCRTGIDHVFTNEESITSYYRGSGVKTSVFPSLSVFGFGTSIEKEYDVGIIGTPYPERINFINRFLESVPRSIKLLTLGPPCGVYSWNQGKAAHKSDEQLSPQRILEVYSKCKIILVLNRHSNPMPETPARGFIEAASGSMVLIDNTRPKIADYFEIGKEMAMFSTTQDCWDKILYYLDHETEREEMAIRGKERAKLYTYENRLRRAIHSAQAGREMIL